FLAQLAVKAGVPAGLINVVLGDGLTTGTAITGHPDIAKVSFTGSTGAGAAIMAKGARTRRQTTAPRLGGKSPHIGFAAAQLHQAAAAIAGSILANAGQACVAGSRLIVQACVAEPLVEAIIGHMKAVQAGPTWDATTTYSPIISESQRTRIHSIVQQA